MRRIILFLLAALAVPSVDAASYEQIGGTIVDPILDIGGNVLAYSGNNLEPSADLNNADLNNADLNNADLNNADLNNADLNNANLTNANLTDANLSSATLFGASLISADLDGADLIGTDLGAADLTGATLTGAYFAGCEVPPSACTLTGATLTGAYFAGAFDPPSTSSQLALTPLDETIIGGAQLHEANFGGADLSGAIFDHENDAYDATGWETATWTGASFHYLNPTLFPTGMIHTDHGIVVRTPEPAAILLALLGLALLPRRRRR